MLIENNLLQIYDSFHFFLASNQHRHLFHPFYMLKQENLNHHTPTILHSLTVFYFLFSSECWWQTIRSSREIIPGGSSGKRRNIAPSGLILNECLVLDDPQSQQDFKKWLLTCCPTSRPSICKSYDRNHGKFISLDRKKKNSDSFKEDWNSNYWFFKEKKINRGFLPSVQANINFTWLKIFLPLKFKV